MTSNNPFLQYKINNKPSKFDSLLLSIASGCFRFLNSRLYQDSLSAIKKYSPVITYFLALLIFLGGTVIGFFLSQIHWSNFILGPVIVFAAILIFGSLASILFGAIKQIPQDVAQIFRIEYEKED